MPHMAETNTLPLQNHATAITLPLRDHLNCSKLPRLANKHNLAVQARSQATSTKPRLQ